MLTDSSSEAAKLLSLFWSNRAKTICSGASLSSRFITLRTALCTANRMSIRWMRMSAEHRGCQGLEEKNKEKVSHEARR